MVRNYILFIFSVIISASLFVGCGAEKPYIESSYENWRAASPPDTGKLKYSVFLIGDAGSPSLDPIEPNFKLMRSMLFKTDTFVTKVGTEGELDTVIESTSDPRHTVVFLGDNLYYDGLPKPDESDRAEKEAALIAQMDVVKGMKGNYFFIPGNHDWDEQGRGGWAAVLRQQNFVDAYFDTNTVFQPRGGCPGPVEIPLGDDLVLILIDSQWWLHRFDKPSGPEDGCTATDEFDFIVQLDDIVQRNEGKNILICQHHPLFSNSSHGGWFNWVDWVFPLTLVRDHYYIPLPIIGSIYPLMRQYGITRQDMLNPVYKRLKDGQLSVIEEEPYVVMATGHDHNLQMKRWGQFHHIVSGSGCKDNFARNGNDVIFAYAEEGFVRLNYYTNGEVWAEAWEAIDEGDSGRIVFRTPLYARLPKDIKELAKEDLPNFSDSSTYVAAGPQYAAGGFKRFFLGDHYRNVWAEPVHVEYLELTEAAGGLVPLKKGGGMQTISLRFADSANVQYNFRSINKNPAAILPESFQNTFAREVAQDQISAAHPYGALTLAPMAEAINIHHTHPQLYYMPHTPLLGPYMEEFGGMLGLIEIRPDEDLSLYEQFGYSENVVSTRTLYRHLYEDNDNSIDQKMFLKGRLFDMLVGDWDRHEDQWRWAEFEKKGKGSYFEPVPRDRDQAFFKFDGVLPWIASRKWAVRKLQSFDHDFGDIIGLNLNGTHLDRSLLTEMTKQDWLAAADSIQKLLTDEVIDKAVKQMPEAAYQLSGEEIAAKLKSRRDKLDEAARKYYEVLARQVDVVGSDKHEYFEVERINDQETRVTVYKTKKEGDVRKKLYERIFYTNETNELRLYGLAGQDSFVLSGVVRKGPEIRIIGGPEDDVFINNSVVKGLFNDVSIYDDLSEGNRVEGNRDTKIRLTDEVIMNTYDPTSFQYDYIGPRAFIEYNIDDGIFLGGGLYIKTFGFKKDPAMEESIMANYATNTGAYTFKYAGDFYHLFGRNWDLSLDATSYGPKYVLNYFGLGNETEDPQPIEFYRVRMNEIKVSPAVQHRIVDFFRIGIGPTFNYILLEDDDRYNILDSLVSSELPDDPTKPEYFLGASLNADIDLVDNDFFPRRGIRFFNNFGYNYELDGSDNFFHFDSDFRFYVTPYLAIPTTFAIRIGGAHNFGEFNFYQANFLGNSENLRGFRKTRYAGRSSFYTNFDVRMSLVRFDNYIFSGNSGLIGFYDVGRVWADQDNSTKWHMGYGPGVFLNFYEYLMLSGHLGFSEEGRFINVDFGFFF